MTIAPETLIQTAAEAATRDRRPVNGATPPIGVERLIIKRQAGRPAVHYVVDEIPRGAGWGEGHNLGGGSDVGAVIVRLNVDGEPEDRVQVDRMHDPNLCLEREEEPGDLERVERAIAALRVVRDELAALYAPRVDTVA